MPFERRLATPADAQDIAGLVNRAYRPPSHCAGWTHESHLIRGERTTTSQVRELLQAPCAVLLLCHESTVVACVLVKRLPVAGCASIGMLATEPTLQNQGLGKQMLTDAEAYASLNFQADSFQISLLSKRPELLAFYQRRGYQLTGEVSDYPTRGGVGTPKVGGVEVLTLTKSVNTTGM
jgi:GNAT superfamily N-acetyltransferase